MAVDTRMNGIIHAALRRDLDRMAIVLERPEEVAPERLRALGEHTEWLMDMLHDHHSSEDDHLFPMVRRNNPDAAPLLDEMESEHAAIAGAVTVMEDAGRGAVAGAPGAAAALRDAVAGLRAVLDPHLEHEERDFTSVVQNSGIPDAEFKAFEKSNTAGRKPPELAFVGHWMLDNLDPAGAAVVASKVPAVPRFIMLRFLGGAYRRRAEACWGGTPAAGVRAVPLS